MIMPAVYLIRELNFRKKKQQQKTKNAPLPGSLENKQNKYDLYILSLTIKS